jgi:Etoposide-induced protein 2.4 (EI24)
VLNRIAQALTRGVASQLHPKMLGLLVLPFVLSIIVWSLTAWLAWDPLVAWFRESALLSNRVMLTLTDWLKYIGIGDFNRLVAQGFTILLVLPAMFASALVAIATLAMPIVMRYLSAAKYPQVQRKGSLALAASIGNAVSSVAIFIVGYLLTLPLWLIPPLSLLVPLFWWGWLTARVMRFDSLVEHADASERVSTVAQYRREYLLLGIAVSALNLIPPLFLITPVLSALVFGHFSLTQLERRRASAGEPQLQVPLH